MAKMVALVAGAILAHSGVAFAASCDAAKLPICKLNEPYDPTKTTDYRAPACSGNVQPNEASLIRVAFSRAPEPVKQEICSLKQIFVSAGDWGWGLWANPDHQNGAPRPNGENFIGLPQGLLGKKLSLIEEETLNRLITDYPSWAKKPKFQIDRDSTVLGALALIAHELGHILWHTRKDQELACYRGVLKQVWEANALPDTPRQWIAFKEEQGVHRAGIPQVKEISEERDHKKAYKKLRLGYLWSFPSFLGAYSPEEDFIETYKLLVLTNATEPTSPARKRTRPRSVAQNMITSFEIKFGGKDTFDVLESLDEWPMNEKRDCIKPLVSGP